MRPRGLNTPLPASQIRGMTREEDRVNPVVCAENHIRVVTDVTADVGRESVLHRRGNAQPGCLPRNLILLELGGGQVYSNPKRDHLVHLEGL